jgi:uncharacterized protein
MKWWPLLLVLALLQGAAYPRKEVDRFVFDHAVILEPEEILRLDSLFRGHERRTGNEIALVTTHDYQGYGDLRTFAATFGDSLGVGKKRLNNGVVIAFSKELREVFIATGLGTERVLPDERVQHIINLTMIPLFKEDMYFDGLWEGSREIVAFLELPGHEIR